MAKTLGIKTTLHKLRHYSATELIAAGVDIRTVAGRLGHGGGGTTTLKVYTAWVSEQDQRAARNLFSRMPERTPRPKPVPTAPYEIIADDLRKEIASGTLPIGALVPTNEELARAHGVSVATAHRAVSLLNRAGLIEVSRGRRATVIASPPPDPVHPVQAMTPPDAQKAEAEPPHDAPQARSMRERLQVLDSLAREGLISAEEHTERRKELLREI
jgi:DNA-binding transcriptional regulator YhcF (GntR family)